MGLGDSLVARLSAFNAKDANQALNAAVKTVQSYCGWVIAPTVTGATATVWSRDGRTVALPTLMLTGLTALSQNSVSISTTNVTFETFGIVRLNTTVDSFSKDYQVSLTYDHGYASFPEDVEDTILQVAQRALTDTRGIVPRTSGGPVFIENRGPRLEDTDKLRLAPYVLGGFA